MADSPSEASKTTIDLHSSLETNAKMKIVLLQVQPISPGTFDKYARLLHERSVVELQELLRDMSLAENMENPFNNRDWCQSSVRLDYVTQSEIQGPSKWSDMMSHHKIFAVIGLTEGFESADIETARKEFETTCEAQFHSLPARRLFVVDAHENLSMKEQVEFLPSHHGEAKVKQYLQISINSLITDLLLHCQMCIDLAKRALDYVDSAGGPFELSTSLEEPETENPNPDQKRGRLHKYVGDYLLVAADPADARLYYAEAVELCTKVGDYVWLAAAIEGQAAVLHYETVAANGGVLTEDVIVTLERNVNEVIELYEKHNMKELQIEGAIKLFHIQLYDGCTAMRTITTIWELTSMSRLNKEILVPVVRWLADTCAQHGWMRKSALFHRYAGVIQAQTRQHSAALHSYLHAAKLYKLPITLSSSGLLKPVGSKGHEDHAKRSANGGKRTGWTAIQLELLREMHHLASITQEGNYSHWYTQLLLYVISRYPLQVKQETLLDLEQKAPRFPATKRDVLLAPLKWVSQLKVDRLPVHLEAVEQPKKSAIHGLFIYNPYEHKDKQKSDKIEWICGETAEISCKICNPFKDCKLVLETVSINIPDLPVEVWELHQVEIKPGKSKTLLLKCKPLSTGFGTLAGIAVQWKHAPFKRRLLVQCKDDALVHQKYIKVLPQLPLIKDVVFHPNPVLMYHGEALQPLLTIENITQIPITLVQLTMHLDDELPANRNPFQASDLLTVQYDAAILEAIHVHGGCTGDIPLTLHSSQPLPLGSLTTPRPNNNGNTSSPKHGQELMGSITVHVLLKYGLNVAGFDVPGSEIWESQRTTWEEAKQKRREKTSQKEQPDLAISPPSANATTQATTQSSIVIPQTPLRAIPITPHSSSSVNTQFIETVPSIDSITTATPTTTSSTTTHNTTTVNSHNPPGEASVLPESAQVVDPTPSRPSSPKHTNTTTAASTGPTKNSSSRDRTSTGTATSGSSGSKDATTDPIVGDRKLDVGFACRLAQRPATFAINAHIIPCITCDQVWLSPCSQYCYFRVTNVTDDIMTFWVTLDCSEHFAATISSEHPHPHELTLNGGEQHRLMVGLVDTVPQVFHCAPTIQTFLKYIVQHSTIHWKSTKNDRHGSIKTTNVFPQRVPHTLSVRNRFGMQFPKTGEFGNYTINKQSYTASLLYCVNNNNKTMNVTHSIPPSLNTQTFYNITVTVVFTPCPLADKPKKDTVQQHENGTAGLPLFVDFTKANKNGELYVCGESDFVCSGLRQCADIVPKLEKLSGQEESGKLCISVGLHLMFFSRGLFHVMVGLQTRTATLSGIPNSFSLHCVDQG